MKHLSLILVLVLLTQPSMAAWDPASFIQLLTQAEQHYKAGEYEKAITTYKQLTQLLNVAIRNKEIPQEQLPRAEQALEDIRYQIGRSQQQLGHCHEADTTFTELQGSAKLSDAARSKLTVRLVETQLCLAEQSNVSNDFAQAGVYLVEGDARLSAAATQGLTGELAQELAAAQARRDIIHKQTQDDYVDAVHSDILAVNCEAAEQSVASPPPNIDPAVTRSTRETFDRSICGTTPVLEYMPYAVAGVGGVLFLSGLFVDAAGAEDAENYTRARSDCLGGEGPRCQDALDLVDDVESARNASIGLVVTGSLLMVGGATWWLLTTDLFDEDDAAAAQPDAVEGAGARLSLIPSLRADGASLGLHLQW